MINSNWKGSAKRDYPWHASYGVFGTSPRMHDYYYVQEDEVHFDLTRNVWKTFDLKNATQQWVEGTLDNQGVVLWATNENDDGYDMRMRSSEYGTASYHPKLEIKYKREFVKNYYLKDHLGNIRVTIDEEGDVVGYDDYYPFGLQMPGRSSNTANPNDLYKFSGKELDEENNLDWYYFGARYYDPAIGRFLSPDPLANLAPAWTPYRYAFNNPLKYIDPTGLWEDPISSPQYRGWYGKDGNKWSPGQSKFGKVRGENYHQGVDLYAKEGTETVACEDGKIVTADKEGKGDFGKQVIIKFTKTVDGKEVTRYARYAHLKEVSVSEGDKVKEGAKVGKTGTTGNAKNLKKKQAHLHFEIMKKKSPGVKKTGNDNRENPADYMTIKDAKKDDQKGE